MLRPINYCQVCSDPLPRSTGKGRPALTCADGPCRRIMRINRELMQLTALIDGMPSPGQRSKARHTMRRRFATVRSDMTTAEGGRL